AEVPLDELDPRKLRHRQDIGGEHASARTHPRPGVLAPAPRGGPQVEADRAGPEELLAPVNLLELEHRPRAPALALGTLHVSVLEVLPEPSIAALGPPG